jgi:hypothetical protein
MAIPILNSVISGKVRFPLLPGILFILLLTCIDPFNPQIKGTGSILVVDALLTNENRSYSCKLSRTIQTQYADPTMVTGAEVVIRDINGFSNELREAEPGIYRSDSLEFLGEAGHSYVLNIKTSNGMEYESDTCYLNPTQPIDTIYFLKDQEIAANGSEIQEGIRIFINSANTGGCKYFRWLYNEWWKFSVPYPKKYLYFSEDSITEVDTIKQVCWASHKSDEFILKSMISSVDDRIERKPILFIDPAESDRLLIQYCIEIRQLSLSATEYEFWDQLALVNEGGSGIFEKQPFTVLSNIHNKNNPDELVLGYFQVSGADLKRIYITPDQLSGLNLAPYKSDCEIVYGEPDPDYGSFDQIYEVYTSMGYLFIEPAYDIMYHETLTALAFSKPQCALCTVRGSLTKPDFWVDIEPPVTRK